MKQAYVRLQVLKRLVPAPQRCLMACFADCEAGKVAAVADVGAVEARGVGPAEEVIDKSPKDSDVCRHRGELRLENGDPLCRGGLLGGNNGSGGGRVQKLREHVVLQHLLLILKLRQGTKVAMLDILLLTIPFQAHLPAIEFLVLILQGPNDAVEFGPALQADDLNAQA